MTWGAAEAEQEYRSLIERAAADDNVLGVVLAGSRATGVYATEHSDYDVYVITREPSDLYVQRRGAPVEEIGMTMERFEQHAVAGSDLAWNRPTFLQARVELDRLDGGIAELVGRIGRLAPDEARAIAAEALDDYINALYRSLKNLEGARDLAGRLDANESVGPLLTTLFALEGRVRPFNKWLAYELERTPLPVPDLLPRIQRIVATGDTAAQRSLFRAVETLARARAHDAIVDGWEPDVGWLRGG